MMGTYQEKLNDYDGFVEKFKPKRTTDDCITPDYIYDAVLEWVCEKYGVDPAKVVRPFWPGGDYLAFDYPLGAVVVDNPPFSILSQICDFYYDRGIPFFLFAPSLTFLSNKNMTRYNHICCNMNVIYENGANVQTGFITSFGDSVVMSAPDLYVKLKEIQDKRRKEENPPHPVNIYPPEIVTSSMVNQYAKYGVEFALTRADCTRITSLENDNDENYEIYGCGLLLSIKGQAERERAERERAERERAERERAERERAERERAERNVLHLYDRDRLSIPYIGKGVQR